MASGSVCFIPYGSTESTESFFNKYVSQLSHSFIPYGSTESTERHKRREEKALRIGFHPIRLDREH